MTAKGEDDSRTQALPTPPWLREGADRLIIAIRLQPSARRAHVLGPDGDRLKVAVAAPPTEGRANAALRRLLAARLGLPLSVLCLVSGAASRGQRVRIASGHLNGVDVARRLAGANRAPGRIKG